MSEFFKTSNALKVISSRFPIGVETMYKCLERSFIMKSKFILIIFYILITFNSNLLSNENKNINELKVGLLVPLSGAYSEVGRLTFILFTVSS